MRKNTFYDGTKKILCKNLLGLFVHVQRWVVQKNTARKARIILTYTQIRVEKIFPIVKTTFLCRNLGIITK